MLYNVVSVSAVRKRNIQIQTDTEGQDGDEKAEAETGAMLLQPKESLEPSETGRGDDGSSPRGFRRTQCLDFGLLASTTTREYISIVLSPQFVVLCYYGPGKQKQGKSIKKDVSYRCLLLKWLTAPQVAGSTANVFELTHQDESAHTCTQGAQNKNGRGTKVRTHFTYLFFLPHRLAQCLAENRYLTEVLIN